MWAIFVHGQALPGGRTATTSLAVRIGPACAIVSQTGEAPAVEMADGVRILSGRTDVIILLRTTRDGGGGALKFEVPGLANGQRVSWNSELFGTGKALNSQGFVAGQVFSAARFDAGERSPNSGARMRVHWRIESNGVDSGAGLLQPLFTIECH